MVSLRGSATCCQFTHRLQAARICYRLPVHKPATGCQEQLQAASSQTGCVLPAYKPAARSASAGQQASSACRPCGMIDSSSVIADMHCCDAGGPV
eukprot:365796-Chlamydomonas_euryale.AAC.22